MVVSLNSMSRVLVMNKVGGIPCKSAKNGESTGSLGSAELTYTASHCTPFGRVSGCPESPWTPYTCCESPVCVKSPAPENIPECTRKRQANLLDFDRDFRSEHGPSG